MALSFQRYPLTGTSVLHELPRSWGALPVVDTEEAGRLLLPVPDGEGVWLGLLPDRGSPAREIQVAAALSSQGVVDVATGQAVRQSAGWRPVPSLRSVPGIARGENSWWPLSRAARAAGTPACEELTVRLRPGAAAKPRPEVSVRVSFVDPVEWEERTGHAVPPLRPDAPYGGWRLP
ncbi:hypothetical protein [Geodermatophilus sp. SYSU D00710]